MQGKFWPAHEAVFLSQPAWRELEEAKPVIHQAVRQAGVDMAALDRCEADPAVEQRIVAERQEGLAVGLKSTPTFYINGQMVVGFLAMREEMTKIFPDAASIILPADNIAVPASPDAPKQS
jgi:protein-disulfide isomerase